MERIKRNAVKCLLCGDVIESHHVHDCVFCSCGATGVDGGHEYCRVLWTGSSDHIKLLIEAEDDSDENGEFSPHEVKDKS